MKNPWQNIDQPNIDLNVRLVSESHPLSLYWARDNQGRYLFVYKIMTNDTPEKKSLPKLTGISVGISREQNHDKLVLRLNDTSNWEIFFSLCTDLIRATSSLNNLSYAANIFLRRLIRWQELLKKKRLGLLSPEAIKGLIGELLFIEKYVAPVFGWNEAIISWKGPENAPQDFTVHETAIEVKCQTGGTKPTIKITSAEQLTPQLPEGYLVVYTIATTENDDISGFSLNDLVIRIRKKIEQSSESAYERFEELLFMTGYIWREEYDETLFKQIAIKCFEIRDNFPRISLSSIPLGVEHVTYSLKLEACKPFEAIPNWWRELL
ncbi:PD-(D/E)XK motif protein [Desulfoluna butyratoxydans]|uniref:Putative pd-(D/e)xk family member (Duf4420) n=1 Tax=Desulfoluna butyratoxydans TaxID=231438 RepID=A0A4U8YHF1_9BACT|nr:PD-(D/E)XK motif protein [Desulfoluna butyratoxydans]VFQ42971.1 putative pd-(d/e)xk family member (duf4420) [Desulfoluna butyratoxydans]